MSLSATQSPKAHGILIKVRRLLADRCQEEQRWMTLADAMQSNGFIKTVDILLMP